MAHLLDTTEDIKAPGLHASVELKAVVSISFPFCPDHIFLFFSALLLILQFNGLLYLGCSNFTPFTVLPFPTIPQAISAFHFSACHLLPLHVWVHWAGLTQKIFHLLLCHNWLLQTASQLMIYWPTARRKDLEQNKLCVSLLLSYPGLCPYCLCSACTPEVPAISSIAQCHMHLARCNSIVSWDRQVPTTTICSNSGSCSVNVTGDGSETLRATRCAAGATLQSQRFWVQSCPWNCSTPGKRGESTNSVKALILLTLKAVALAFEVFHTMLSTKLLLASLSRGNSTWIQQGKDFTRSVIANHPY